MGFLIKRDLVQARREIQKAWEFAPSWNAMVYSGAIIDYFSGISPAVPLHGIPQWPGPPDWSFIKTDDLIRAYFRSTVAAFGTFVVWRVLYNSYNESHALKGEYDLSNDVRKAMQETNELFAAKWWAKGSLTR